MSSKKHYAQPQNLRKMKEWSRYALSKSKYHKFCLLTVGCATKHYFSTTNMVQEHVQLYESRM
jgi:hypothetical protein